MIEKPWHRHYDYNVPTTIRYPRLVVHELLDLPAGAYPDKAALIFFGGEMSFYELRQESRRFANALAGPRNPEGRPGGTTPAQLPSVSDCLLRNPVHRGNSRQPQSFIHARRAETDGQYFRPDVSCHI